MSFFNKALASLGLGAAKVDTKLHNDKFMIGEEVKGVIEISGGNVEQPIDEIYLSVVTTYIKEADDKKYTQTSVIGKFRVLEKLTIAPNEKREVPFSFSLPFDTPITIGKTRVWIHTGLDIKNAIDPTDKDFITVEPSPLVQSVFQAAQDLGFKLREAECIEAPRYLRGKLPFVQEFEFIPTSGEFRGKLDELEIVFLPKTESALDVLMQIDRKAKGLSSLFAEALEMDESNVRLSITTQDIPSMKAKLFDVIKRYS
ncbi:sporulation protein [Bacillus salitolerans]|uniref:Sporulation protein n=1 Tax=Bacillus salitolerans TaxID=1437434 RepID=A0ABW4LNX9_9BACI